MLKRFLFALLFAGLVYAASPAVAQDSGNNDQPAPHGRGHMDPAKRTAMLTKQLNLNADQQAKVQDIYKSEQSQMESLRSDSSVSQDDRHAKMTDIHKATNDQVRALLDPDQQKKFDEMQSMHKDHMQGHQQGGDAPAPPQ